MTGDASFLESHDEDDGDRATALPPFDPVVFARESESAVGARGAGAIPEESPTAPRHLSGTREAVHPRQPQLASPLDSIPVIAVAREDLEWFKLDEAARDVLDCIDGISTLRETLARAHDVPTAGRALWELAEHGIIEFRPAGE